MSDYAITVLLIVVLGTVAGIVWMTTLPKLRNRRLALLGDSHNRLKTITAELLEKANDLDQQIKFSSVSGSAGEQAKLKCVFDDLVILADTIPTIDLLIEERRISETNSMLSAASKLAEKVNGLIKDVSRSVAVERSNKDVVDVDVID